MSEAKLTIKIDNTKPVEIMDFTDSFKSLGSQYYKFLSESEYFKLSKTTKFYIKEVRTGSIITELTDLVPLVIPFVENSNSVIEFSAFLKLSYDYLLGKTDAKPKEFDITDCNNLNNIIKPVAKDKGSNMVFTGDFNFGDVTIEMNFNSVEANAIQNAITKEKELLKEPELNKKTKMLFYWDSAKYNSKSKAIDRGIIEAISKSALKVEFENENIKSKMLDIDFNPFHMAYVVDVEIQEIKDNPVLYKILELHDQFEQ
ncbi:hypothetical protein [Polaribacter sp. IC063]|uniref:hypothetical protein n=1 Tax=Polaribacter sp. IC063 TaxID=57031 RepID=UPI0011BF6846|nr:hypothetical protein [Polaribacter sp. IC063]TXD53644.1 hypothetical protein ES043_03200 [Polaribacter sp. IC063]